MARNWSNRSPGYKTGCVMLIVGTLMYVIGYSSPFWLLYRDPIGDGSGWFCEGLWMTCYNSANGETQCDTFTDFSISMISWIKAVQGLQTVALIGLSVSCLYAFIVNCCWSTAQYHSRFLESFAGLSGSTGFMGMMVFVGKTDSEVQYYHWAFALDLTGCLLAILASTVLYCNNSPQLTPQSSLTTTGATTVMPGQSYPPSSDPEFAMTYTTSGMNSQPGAYPSAPPLNGGYPSNPPQGYSWYPPTGSTMQYCYSGNVSNSQHSGSELPPSYDSIMSDTTPQPPQYGSQYAPQLGYLEESKTTD